MKIQREPTAFTEEQTKSLVGLSVLKRFLSEESPAVKIGQQGIVINAVQSDLTRGFAVEVDWGDREIWIYDDWFEFGKDVNITEK